MSFTLVILKTHLNKSWNNDILIVTKLNKCLGTQIIAMYDTLKTPVFLNLKIKSPRNIRIRKT